MASTRRSTDTHGYTMEGRTPGDPVVHESIDAMFSTRVLIFESDKIARRVREFPPTWRELSDEDLWKLSWKR